MNYKLLEKIYIYSIHCLEYEPGADIEDISDDVDEEFAGDIDEEFAGDAAGGEITPEDVLEEKIYR